MKWLPFMKGSISKVQIQLMKKHFKNSLSFNPYRNLKSPVQGDTPSMYMTQESIFEAAIV